jgi:hypothetical protein
VIDTALIYQAFEEGLQPKVTEQILKQMPSPKCGKIQAPRK